MGEYVGVDWGSNGWVCAIFDDGEWTARHHPSFLSVWHNHRDAESILVDIPIGLEADGLRECDEEAAEELGGRHQSVFFTPPRPVFEEDNYSEGKRTYRELTGRGMTTQAWSFMPRIRELEEFLVEYPNAHGAKRDSIGGIREVHPEISFSKLADGEVTDSKRRSAGEDERKGVLEAVFESAADSYDDLVKSLIDDLEPHERRFRSSHRDDILDAMVLAATAALADGEYRTMPENPPEDERGLPMEIVYTEPT